MPQRIPMPDCLTFFLMIGNETSELAAHIVSSVRDHCAEPDCFSVNCISLVDDSFDEETVSEPDLYYKVSAMTAEELQDMIIKVVRKKMKETMENVSGLSNFSYSLTRIMYVFVMNAAGKCPLSDLNQIRETLIAETRADGKRPGAFLCLIADNDYAIPQRKWLMKDDGMLREEADQFEKVLLLTPQNMLGFHTISTTMDMMDVAFPAMIMMLNGHTIINQDKLYTAAYSKMGGTSNDIRELKRHIAASTLDAIFGNEGALKREDVYNLLSTDRIMLNITGKSLEAGAMECAAQLLPQLRHLVLTADLEDKDFDPIGHILKFDSLNREKMTEPGNLPEEWLAAVKKRLLQCPFPDAVYAALNKDDPKGVAMEIIRTWSSLMAKAVSEETQKPGYMENRLKSGRYGHGKKLCQKWRDYNLMCLNVALGVYADVCRERIAYRILDCLQNGIEPLRAFLKEMISRRKAALQPYQIDENKLGILKEMCPVAAAELEESYKVNGLVEGLPTFIQHKSKLYSEDGRAYWISLYHEFLNQGTMTSSFSEAFCRNTGKDQIAKKVTPLGEKVPPMIPSYPDELGVLPEPQKSFLLNRAVADMLSDKLMDAVVYQVPGDVMEYVALYPLSNKLDPITQLTMFRKSATSKFFSGDDDEPTAVQGRKKGTISTEPAMPGAELNPWKIRIVDSFKGSGKMLCWVYPAGHGDATIRFNGKVIREGYTYKDYSTNGMCLPLTEEDVPTGNVLIEIRCGDETGRFNTEVKKDGEPLQFIATGPRAKGRDGEEFIRGKASDDRYEGRCLVFTDDPQRWQIPFEPDDNQEINPLWCASEYEELELEDL